MSPKNVAGFFLPLGLALAAPRPDAPIDIPITISKASAPGEVDTARTTLLAIRHDVFRCAPCGVELARAGSCPACGGKLEREEGGAEVLTAVAFDGPGQVAHLTLAAGQTLALSEVDRALSLTRIRVARERLTVPVWSKLVITGIASKDDAEELEDLLLDKGMFGKVAVTFDKAALEASIIVRKTAEEPKSLARIATTLITGHDGVRIADLVFTTPCAKCAEKGAGPGCARCWKPTGT